VEVDPPRRLVFTWCTSATDAATTLVPIELDAEGQRATNLREGCLALLDRHAAALRAR